MRTSSHTAISAVGVVALAATFILAVPSPAASRDCAQIKDRNERRECLREETDRLIFELQVHVCARRLTENALAPLGLEMGFTAKTTPAQIVTEFSAHPERQEQRLEQALNRAAERFSLMLYNLVVVEDENEREVLSICVETLSDQEKGAVIEERSKSPTTAQPIDLEWLDDVMTRLDERSPERVELGVDCTEPFMVGLPDDVLTECETE